MKLTLLKHAAERVYPWSSKLDRALVRARYRICWRLAKRLSLKRILDIGCGFGVQYTDTPLDTHVIAIDIDLTAVRYVKLRYSSSINIDVVQSSAVMLPFRSASVDMVLLMDVIEHVSKNNALRVVSEAKRVSRTIVVVATPNRALSYGNPHHVHEYTVSELVKLLRKANLKILALLGQVPSLRLPVSLFMTIVRSLLDRVFNAALVEERELESVFTEDELLVLARCEPYRPTLLRDYGHILAICVKSFLMMKARSAEH